MALTKATNLIKATDLSKTRNHSLWIRVSYHFLRHLQLGSRNCDWLPGRSTCGGSRAANAYVYSFTNNSPDQTWADDATTLDSMGRFATS